MGNEAGARRERTPGTPRAWAILLAMVGTVAAATIACSGDEDSSTLGSSTTSTGSGGAAGDGGATSSSTGGSGGSGEMAGGAPSRLWSMGYYASWKATLYPVAEIEWSGLTHIATAFYSPQADGSLDLMAGDPSLADDLVIA